MGQDQSSVFDLAAVAAASNGGNNDPLLPPARFIGEPQKPSDMPYTKYVAYDKQVPFDYPERTWPGKRLQRAPRWCSVDLRDGNQALVNPMDSERKLRFWNLLVSMGFKEIEVGFPSASETDFDFIRMLIERELIPDDVTIVVLTQCREHLIRRTYEALKGAKRAIVHFYNSVSVLQREVVFRKNKEEIKKLAIKKGLEARQVAAERAGADLDSFVWLVPYLPIDPKDIGRTYEAIIRVNSQSGKGGMAYLLKTNHNLDLPKRLQIEFDKIVQNFADTTKKEVKDEDIWRLFKDEYLPVEQSGMTAAGVVVGDTHDASLAPWGRLKLLKVSVSSGEDGSDTVLKARLLDRGVNVGGEQPVEREVSGIGNGPIAAFLNAISNFGVDASIMDYVEHTMSVGTDAMAASYVECQVGEADDAQIVWGVGIDSSITTSALKAIISAINRSQRNR